MLLGQLAVMGEALGGAGISVEGGGMFAVGGGRLGTSWLETDKRRGGR